MSTIKEQNHTVETHLSSPSWKERWSYAFDNYMAKGTPALIAGLAGITLILIFITALFVWVTRSGPEDVGFLQLMWMSMLRTFDPGTMGGDQGSWPFLLSMLFITVGGIFVFSALIGVLTAGIDARIEVLRKGRSRVIEKNHTIILGWSEQVFAIITELAIANQNQTRPCVVIMGEKDKTEMEDEIVDKVEDLANLRTVCRSGNPMEISDLDIVNLNTAKGIIILSPEGDDPDSSVIKTMLAITRSPNRKKEPYHIVAQIRKPSNMDVARMVGGDEATLILQGEMVARIIAQTCRQSGLSTVYTELMDFGGDEIYFHKEDGLVGKTYGEALLAYEDSAIIGLYTAGGQALLNPPMETPIDNETMLIAVSEDDDTVILSKRTSIDLQTNLISMPKPVKPAPEHILILGWNWRGTSIVNELDHYVAAGSSMTVLADLEDEKGQLFGNKLKNLSCKVIKGEITDRKTLETLDFKRFTSTILLAYSDIYDVQKADSLTLITLLHLRDIADRDHLNFSIVSEMMDVRNQRLATVTRADDFVVSNRLVSLLMAQISEEKRLEGVFEDILDPEGSEIYLKPAAQYVELNAAMNFYTVVESARRQGHTAFGYRIGALAYDAQKDYGVVINPSKLEEVRFADADEIIVLAES